MIRTCNLLAAACLPLALGLTGSAAAQRYFEIQVVDEATGRGVPLVELETLNHLVFVTDSHGRVAIDEPDLMGQTVYFTVRSHGYTYPKDGFGSVGKAWKVEPGGAVTLPIQRTQIAERLYRTTGSGIYRDSVLLGHEVPVSHPLLQAQVFGCDSVMTAVYRNKMFWFWGDTTRPHYPLGGNFHITGATSQLPGQGGLDPADGVEFDYFVDSEGAVRPMAAMPGQGPTWISKLTVLRDEGGRERMYAGYVKIRNQLEAYRWGFVVWNDDQERFEQVTSFETRPRMFIGPQCHPFHKMEGDQEYVYFCHPFPLTRVPADAESFTDPERYEGFTCLKPGTLPANRELDRAPDGRLRYGWKVNTPPLSYEDQTRLIEAGLLRPDERRFVLVDPDTGRQVHAHGGSVYWNDYRKRWVMVAVEANGDSSYLGEVWYAEADAPTGPWRYARKVVTHDRYSFYNPKHHPQFDQQGGRIIYFEGTYTQTFSGNPVATPRYDYNQVMYRLDLASPRLNLPVAVYRTAEEQGRGGYVLRAPGEVLAFFALERPAPGCRAVRWTPNGLRLGEESDVADGALFYAVPADQPDPPPTTTPLYEFVHQATGARIYSTSPSWSARGYRRTEPPVFRVWSAANTAPPPTGDSAADPG